MGLTVAHDPYQEDAILNSILGEEVEDDFGEDVEYESAEEGEMMEIDNGDFCRGDVEGGTFKSTENSLTLQEPKSSDSRCKRKRKSSRPSIDVARFVQVTCEKLEEPKKGLIWNAVHKLGLEALQELLREVDAIQVCGGQMTADGKRRRSPGGVLWNIVRARVSPELYKDIMNVDRTIQKKKDKDRRKKKLRKVQPPTSVTTPLRPVSQEADGARGKKSSATLSTHPLPSLPHLPSADVLSALAAEPVQGRDTCSLSLSNAINSKVISEGTREEGVALGSSLGSEGLDAELNRKLAPGVVARWRHSWATAVSSDEVETGKEDRAVQDRMQGVQIPFKLAERSVGEELEGSVGGAEGENNQDGETDGVQDQEVRKLTLQERLRFQVKYEGIIDGLGGEGGEKLS